MREAVPSTFEKCLDDSALYKWSDDIHCNIYDAALLMMDVLILKLQHLRDEEFDVEAEEDLIQLLKTLSLAFDCTCHFHEHHIRDPLPTEIEVEFNFAEPLLVTPAENEMQEDNLPQEGHFWLAALLNAMGDKQGYTALEEVHPAARNRPPPPPPPPSPPPPSSSPLLTSFPPLLLPSGALTPPTPPTLILSLFPHCASSYDSVDLQALESPQHLSINLLRAGLLPISTVRSPPPSPSHSFASSPKSN